MLLKHPVFSGLGAVSTTQQLLNDALAQVSALQSAIVQDRAVYDRYTLANYPDATPNMLQQARSALGVKIGDEENRLASWQAQANSYQRQLNIELTPVTPPATVGANAPPIYNPMPAPTQTVSTPPAPITVTTQPVSVRETSLPQYIAAAVEDTGGGGVVEVSTSTGAPVDNAVEPAQDSVKSPLPWGLIITLGLALFN